MGILLITAGSSRCTIDTINGAKMIIRSLTWKLKPKPRGASEMIVRNGM